MFKKEKKLGQNFLKDKSIVSKMVRELDLGLNLDSDLDLDLDSNLTGSSKNDLIIEVGPGQGVVTREIVKYLDRNLDSTLDNNLICVEKDERLIEGLKKEFEKYPNVEIVHKDILDFLPEFESKVNVKNIKVIGSLPYYITSPILHSIIKMKRQPSVVIILIQKEVGEKILAVKENSNYLSVFIKTFYDVKSLGVVSKDKFNPKPKVDGIVLKLIKKEKNTFFENLNINVINRYEDFLHQGFKYPRKMLKKAFSEDLLDKAEISSNLRPHDLSIEDWIKLFNI